jgi:hypothetical protein
LKRRVLGAGVFSAGGNFRRAEKTLPDFVYGMELFSNFGYRTASAGKWPVWPPAKPALEQAR